MKVSKSITTPLTILMLAFQAHAASFNGLQVAAAPADAEALSAFRKQLDDEGALALIAFTGIPDRATREELAGQGIRLLSYVSERTWVARIHRPRGRETAPRIGGFRPLDVDLRVSAELHEPLDGDRLSVYIHVARDCTLDALRRDVKRAGFRDFTPTGAGPFSCLAGSVPREQLAALLDCTAHHRDVQHIERARGARLLNNDSMRILQSGSYTGTTPFFDKGIHGTNQVIAVCDTGLDIDSCYFRDGAGALPPTNGADGIEVGLSPRKVIAVDFLYEGDDPADPADWDNQGHGTRVAGHALGSKLTDPLGTSAHNGMAPAARLVVQDAGFTTWDNCADLIGLGCPVTNFYRALTQAVAQGATIHNNSWGDRENYNPHNTYTQPCRELDLASWSNKEFLVVCAAGNDGAWGNGGVGSPSVAKNALSVAAANPGSSQEYIASFSSRGWASDGRYKPDLAAPGGWNVYSSSSDGNITSLNCATSGGAGTSYASPMAAGMAALVRDYFAQGFYPSRVRTASDAMPQVSAALVKAVLINAAVPMLHASAPPPARDQGWGRINLSEALAFEGSTTRVFAEDHPPRFAAAANEPYRAHFDVLSSATPFKVTLVWTDFPAAPGANTHLVNDLDLLVRTSAGEFKGNVLSNGWSVAGGAFDRINNVEQVVLQAPATGPARIEVRAHAVPEPVQDFALVAVGVVRHAHPGTSVTVK